MNALVVDLVQPTSEVARVIGAVAQGDLNQTMALEIDGRSLTGEFLRTAKTINTMVDQLNAFASEVTRVAREVGTASIERSRRDSDRARDREDTRGNARGHGARRERGRAGGSEFVVRLPALTELSELPTATDAARAVPTPERRLLVVDDNVDAAESLAVMLGMWGYTVEMAYDGPSAIERARANPPEDRKHARDAGFDHHFVKPIEPSAL